MADHRSNLIRKQKREGPQGAEPSIKRKKGYKVVEPNESSFEIKIQYKHLNLNNLLNIADSRKLSREGVEQAFKSKYGKRCVQIDIIKFESSLKIDESGKEIRIYDFVTGLKFLRCFGKLISSLKIGYRYLQRKHGYELDRCLNDYCTETLKELFLNAPSGAIKGLKRPFINVEKLCLSGELGEKLSCFNRYFPNLQHLKLEISIITTYQHFEFHLPHLRHLDIEQTRAFFPELMSIYLWLNPQLRSLRIKGNNYIRSVVKSASELPHLEELHIESSIAVKY